MSWWRFWRHDRNGAGEIRDQAEAELRKVKRQTARYERLAEAMAALPPEDIVDRVARMFGRQA